jgi:transcriptional regulator with XRE-family HTH domain
MIKSSYGDIQRSAVYTVREAAAVVRELREATGLTQQELASRARVSRSFVADVEAGKPSVEASKLFDVFNALGHEIAVRNVETGEFRR